MSISQEENPDPQRLFTPPIDIYEYEEGLVLLADLPGVTLESLELQIQDNRLTIFGKIIEVLPLGAKPVHREFEFGSFLRSFILSDEVDYDRIVAKLNHGVLEVTLPKAPRTEPRRIKIQSSDGN